MKVFCSVVAAFAACVALQSPATAATILRGSAALSCPPGGCISDTGRLTRIFGAENFAGPVRIDSFVLDRVMLGKFADQTFRLTFWNEDGQQIGDFENFNISVLGGDEVMLRGKGFDYDPSRGKLIMRIQFGPDFNGGQSAFGGFGGGSGGGFAPLAAPALPAPEPIFAPLPAQISPPSPTFLVDVVPLPEPAVWAEMVLGFMLLGGVVRSRRRGSWSMARRSAFGLGDGLPQGLLEAIEVKWRFSGSMCPR